MKKSKFLRCFAAVALALNMAFVPTTISDLPQLSVAAYAATTKLPAPTNFKANVDETSVKLSWDAVTGADAYRVYKYNDELGAFETYKSVASNSCKIKELESNTTYKFKVAALVKSGGNYVVQTTSSKVSVKTSEAKLNAPKSIYTNVTNSSIALSWSEVEGATAYRVYIQYPSNDTYEVYKNVTAASCKVTGLDSDTTYNFKIAALIKKSGKYAEQKQSNEFSVKTKAETTAPAASNTSAATVSSSTEPVTTVGSIKIITSPGKVQNGRKATLKIQGEPNTVYSLYVHYPSKNGEAKGIGKVTSDKNGYAEWTWTVGTRTTQQKHKIEVKSGNKSYDLGEILETYKKNG